MRFVISYSVPSQVPSLLPGLGITDDERKMILAAVNLSPGHWFKCQNGHVYCIGGCGGAMETSKCPECNADIGKLFTKNCCSDCAMCIELGENLFDLLCVIGSTLTTSKNTIDLHCWWLFAHIQLCPIPIWEK